MHLESKEYKDRNMRALSFDVILNTMLEIFPNITISEMKKKINTLRGVWDLRRDAVGDEPGEAPGALSPGLGPRSGT